MESETFVIMGKLSLGSDSNSTLNKKVISGAICLLPLICPHKTEGLCFDQWGCWHTGSGHSTEEGGLNKSGHVWSTMESPKTPTYRPILTSAKGCQELCEGMCYVYVWTCTRDCGYWVLMCEVVQVVRMWRFAKLFFQITYWTGNCHYLSTWVFEKCPT